VKTKKSNKGKLENEVSSAPSQHINVPLAPYWLPAIVESADDAIISKTLDGIITSWNQAAERIFGYKAEEVIGKPILILIPPELQSEETEILRRIRHGERIEHFETIRMRKDGARLHISLAVSPIKTPDGTIIGASKIARDITEQKAIENERRRLLREAEEARREAEAANRAKDQFLALLSHELRTPLHSMKGWLSMLNNGLLSEDQYAKAIEVISRGIDAQKALIEDLLDVSRIVSGKLKIVHELVSLVSVVSHTTDALRPIAAAHGIQLDAELDSSADEVIGDKIRLQQIVYNLVNNAIKYTPAGGNILIVLERDGANAGIQVKDTGIGISSEMLDRIFERFEQADISSRRTYGGLGLGLPIARHLARLHGGDVGGFSEGLGRGSTFTVTLPLAHTFDIVYSDVHGSNSLDGWKDFDEKVLADTNLLIVEDDIDSLELLRISLESSGAAVTSVDRSSKAIDELKSRKFDLMISDLGLPEIDGYDLIRQIRDNLRIAPNELPAVALSGYASDEDRNRSLAHGFQLHLQKPLDISTLPRTIRELIKRS
jgi:PAS domain S-box-containing protein